MFHSKRNLAILFLIFPIILFGQVDYNSEIQSIFNNNCGNCHLGGSSGGLNLSNYDSVMEGGNGVEVLLRKT